MVTDIKNIMIVEIGGVEYYAPSILPTNREWFEAEKLAASLNRQKFFEE